MSNRKIVILANNANGIYNFRKELIETLLAKGCKIFLITPYGERFEDLKKIGCECITVFLDRRGLNPFFDLWLIWLYLKFLIQIKPDVVLTYTIKPNIYGGLVCRCLNIPYIVNITGLGSSLADNKIILRKVIVQLYKIALKKVQCIFFQNQFNKIFFEKYNIQPLKHCLIPGSGVNINKFKLLTYPEDSIVRFLFISRIMKEKGIDDYICVAEKIKEKYSNVEFHIIGKCDKEYKNVIDQYHQKGIINYHGFQKNIISYVSFSHCLIHPSYYPEGMSNVILESEASGRPVITTDRAGCKEPIEHGFTGFIFEERNVEELERTVEEFLSLSYEEKKKLGLNARQKVEKEFNREIVISAYCREISHIIELI